MKKISHLFFTLLLIALSHFSIAQITVSGHLLGATEKEPLIGAHLLNLSAMEKSSVTNEHGFFKLENLSPKDTILISYMGFKENLLSFSKSQDQVELFLEPLKIKLAEVVVKASILGAENFAYKQLEPIDIYLNPNSKADALVAINTSVSSTTKDENAAVSFRGASPNQTGYFLNGVPLKSPVKYAQLTDTGTLSIFNTDFLKNTTVFPGNPPVEYGQSSSGTIVLEMADRFPDEWMQTASISLANVGYSARGKVGNQTFLGAFANYQFDDALKATNPKNFEDINAFESTDVGILVNSHQKWGSLKFYQYGLWDNYNFQYQHPSYENGFRQEAFRSISTLQWIQEYNAWQIRLIFGNSFTQNQYNFGNLNYKLQNTDPYSAIHFSWFEKNDLLKFGYAFWDQKSTIKGYIPELSYAFAPSHPKQYIQENSSLKTHEIYSFYRKLIEAHSFGAGIRVGRVNTLNKNLLSYQMNYLWKLSKQFQIKLGTGKYYQVRNVQQNQITYTNQLVLDINYQNKHLAIDQSFYINRLDNNNIQGTETTLTYKPNSKLTYDQSFAAIKNQGKTEWFIRSFLTYKPYALWSFNFSYQAFKGDTIQIIKSASFNSELEIFEPENENREFKSFNPYQNFSLSINRLYNFNDISGVFFISFNNLFDIKNLNNINYNFEYSNFNKNYLGRRSFYIGVVLNF